MKSSFCYALDELQNVVRTIVPLMHRYPIVALTGSLGAGKTTLVKALLPALGVHDAVTSPTYSYVNIYRTAEHTIFHFDLYRLSSLDEFIALGFDEYLHVPNSLVIIEWPEVIAPLLDDRTLYVNLSYHADQREIVLCTKDCIAGS